MGQAVWRWYLVVGAAVVALYPLVPVGGWQDLLYIAVGSSCPVAIMVGVHLHRPLRRASWYLMALGQLLWVIGDTVDSWNRDVEHVAHFPSDADFWYLCVYPMLAAGLVLLIRSARTRRDLAGLLDGATVTVGLGLLSWVLLARPTITAAQHSLPAATVGVLYPIADIVLVGLLIRLAATSGARTPAVRLLLAAVVLLVAGDTTSAAVGLFTSVDTTAFDVIWLASYLAWGAAALHPSMRTLSEPNAGTVLPFTRGRLAARVLATLAAPAVLAIQWAFGLRLDVWAIVTASVVVFGLVLGRMQVAMEHSVQANRDRLTLQDKLAYQAAHDSLTRLPNRAHAMELMTAALSRAQRSGAMTGLLFLDLDGFKAVNDTYGHPAGDEVLRVAAARMQAQARGGDMVARLGGDEFVVLLDPVDSESDVVEVAARLITAVSEPITIGHGLEVRVGVSVGVAISQDATIDPRRLIGEADTAVYRAKAAGRGRVEVFDDTLRRELADKAHLEAAIVTAIARDELLLHYQPVFDLRTGQVDSFEALVRWDRPGVGLIQPAWFIPLAEASNLICDLDTWVLTEAARQQAEWISAGKVSGRVTVAVNVSGRHLANPRILDDVRTALSAAGLPPAKLILEITETVLIDDLAATEHLHQLRALGVAVSIDDFGTGYNSIARLQHLPVDIVKIDRSFLDTTEPSALKLLQLMVQAGHVFGLPVIAEGVETPAQLDMLKAIGCEAAQGFYLARPMNAADIQRYLASSHTPAIAP